MCSEPTIFIRMKTKKQTTTKDEKNDKKKGEKKERKEGEKDWKEKEGRFIDGEILLVFVPFLICVGIISVMDCTSF